MRAKKSLGQNFLMHAQTAERIADAASLTKTDTVLEIGPGTGMLTRPLLSRAKRVIAVEADAELLEVLYKTFPEEIKKRKLTVIHSDIRVFNPSVIKSHYTLVANIPYYLTGDIIRRFLTANHAPKSVTFLVQKEVAERVARAKKESVLSVAVKTYGTPRYRFTVPRGAFVPAPNVDSAVLTIENISRPFQTTKEETRFFDIVHAGFAHKRKLLRRNLEAIAKKTHIDAVFDLLALSKNIRAEDIPASNWLRLAKELSKTR